MRINFKYIRKRRIHNLLLKSRKYRKFYHLWEISIDRYGRPIIYGLVTGIIILGFASYITVDFAINLAQGEPEESIVGQMDDNNGSGGNGDGTPNDTTTTEGGTGDIGSGSGGEGSEVTGAVSGEMSDEVEEEYLAPFEYARPVDDTGDVIETTCYRTKTDAEAMYDQISSMLQSGATLVLEEGQNAQIKAQGVNLPKSGCEMENGDVGYYIDIYGSYEGQVRHYFYSGDATTFEVGKYNYAFEQYTGN